MSKVSTTWNFFEKILNEVNTLVFVRDAHGIFVYLNQPFASFLKMELQDVLGKHASKVYSNTEHYIRAMQQDEMILKHEEGFTIQSEEPSISNPKLWMQVNKKKIVIEDEPYVLGLLVNISRLKNTENELSRTNHELKEALRELSHTVQELKQTQQSLINSEKMASLGTLAAGLGHEINNPLNFIKGGVNELSRYLNQNLDEPHPEVSRLLEVVNEGVKRASHIVRSLSSFSRYNNDMGHQCQVENILDNCIILLQNKLNDKVAVVKDYKVGKQYVTGNEGRLHQAFLNIIQNAEQSIQTNGKIHLSTAVTDSFITVNIKDDGVGISQNNLKRIMDPFFTTRPAGQGTGLGLSIAYDIIEVHNGKIEVESKVNEGTSITITLPCHADD